MLSLGFRRKHVLMGAIVFLLTILAVVFAAKSIISHYSVLAVDYPMPAGFTDQIFYNAIVNEFKSEFPNETVPSTGLTDTQLAKIMQLIYSGQFSEKITNVEGLEKLTGLKKLDLKYNEISAIDLSGNLNLVELDLEMNLLTTVDLSDLTELTIATVSNNQLTLLDVSQNSKLKELYAKVNQIEAVTFGDNSLLEKIDLLHNKLVTVDVSDMSHLKSLEVHENILTSLDISNDPLLTYVNAGTNDIRVLNTTNDAALITLRLNGNSLSSLDVSSNVALEYLDIDSTQISSIDLSHNPNLKTFKAPSDYFSEFDFSNNPLLETVVVNHQQNGVLTSIDLSANPNLKVLEVYENSLTTLDLSDNTLLQTLVARDNQLSSIVLPSSDTVQSIDLQRNYNLTSIDVSGCPSITKLSVNNNSITEIDLSNNPLLKTLEINSNALSSLDVSNNPSLATLAVDDIPVKAIINVASFGDTVQFSLGNVKFLKTYQTIADTSGYTYDSASKLVTVADNENIIDKVRVASSFWGGTYDLVMPVFLAFDTNGGANGPDAIICYPSGTSDCSYTVPSSSPSRENYYFLGWANTTDAHTKAFSADDTVTKDGYAVIYAVWSPVYKLSFGLNGGTSNIKDQTCYPATDITAYCNVTIPTDGVTKTGYEFLGWGSSASSTAATYASGGTLSMNSNKTIYAVWSPIYTLKFDSNGGSPIYNDRECYADGDITDNCTINTPADLTRSGYEFLGWANSATSNTVDYVPGGSISISADKTLYAVWSPVYTLSFNVNGGTPEILNRECHPRTNITDSCSVEIPDDTLTKEGYTFYGYATSATARIPEYAPGDNYIFINDGSRNVMLYAVFGNSDTDWIDGQEYVKGIDDGITVTVNRPLNTLERVLIDGVEVPTNQYTVDETTGKVFIKGTYLDTLPVGEHTLRLEFSDGTVIELIFVIVVNSTIDPEDSEARGGLEPSDDGEIILNLITPKIPVASVTIEIYDDQGNLVKTIEIKDPSNPVRIDTSDLPDGDYVAVITHKDIDDNVLLVTREEFTVPTTSGDDIVFLPIQTEVDVTERIVIEVYDDDGNLVRTVVVEVETGTVYVYDEDDELIDTIKDRYNNGRIVLPMDGLPSGDYDLDIYFLAKELRQVGALDLEDATFRAKEIPVPDTGRFVGEADETQSGMINIVVASATSVLVASVCVIKRYLAKKNYLTF